MASKPSINRLQKEYKALLKEPVPNIKAHPSTSSILVWHYVLEGPQGSEYEGGLYWGKIEFPSDYPYKPPAISMFTPSGRFKTNTQLCMSMTNYHPESWNPMWSVGTILNGLLSFMQESAVSTGSISASREMRQQLAQESLQWNSTNLTFKKLFPDYMDLEASRSKQEPSGSSVLAAQTQTSGLQPQAAASRPQQAQVGRTTNGKGKGRR
ncbi:hypothetical protein WJX74_000670 [Apatococcus lobatus]|uniref:UBC core domain-containing protein n=1 Tax=Apatococcus lobatus TaxID=904363 RepID=A0AAW1QLQ4_9CHLO